MAGSTQWRKIVHHWEKYKVSSLPTYTVTRWYSLSKLLTNALQLKDAIDEFTTTCGLGSITAKNWEQLKQLEPIVSTFRNVTEDIEGDGFGTLSHVHEGIACLEAACERCNPSWPELVAAWKAARKEYCRRYLPLPGDDGSMASLTGVRATHIGIRDRVLVATVLNPGVEPSTCLSPAEIQKGRELLQSLWSARAGDGPGSSGHARDVPPKQAGSQRTGLTRHDLLQHRPLALSSELERFWRIDRTILMMKAGFDVFTWWRANQQEFPGLFQVALDYLSIPATSASVERQFSKAKLINGNRRQSMKEEKLGTMVLLRENLPLLESVLRHEKP